MASAVAQCVAVSTAARASQRAPARVSSGAPKTPMARRAVSASRGLGVRVRAEKGSGDAGDAAAATATEVGKGKKAEDSKNSEAKKALTKALAKGEPVKGRVEVANRGGLILRVFNGRFRAFLPLSQMASSRTLKVKSTRITGPTTVTAPLASFDDEEEDFVPPPAVPAAEKEEKKARQTGKDAAVAALEGQVGKTIDVKITSVDGTKIVVSERALAQERGAKALEVGVRVSGVIVSLSDFGAFVELSEDDPQAPRMEGLIHISELSWNRISHPRDVVRVGDEVDVKVLDVAPGQGNKPARVTFSLKQTQADPLLETLDTIMPVAMPEPSMDEDELLDTPLPGLMDICANLLTEDGIDAVIPGRQAVEQRVVSQDLELWLTNAVVADGYNLLARAGRQVQEIHVVTGLNRDSIKLAIKRATSAIKK
jgi:predicted RNA-binding protein with RPS1 domain